MLNPFPALLVYGIIAPTLIRLSVGAALFYMAVQHYRGRKESAQIVAGLIGPLSKTTGPILTFIEVVAGGLLIVGAWTQIAALVASVLFIKSLMLKKRLTSLAPLSRSTYLLLLVMSISLLISGAGWYAFDLPL